MTIDYDIVMVSDLRLTGGTTASMAEEIRAHSAAGYRTALMHVNSALTAKALGVSSHLAPLIEDGAADLVLPGDEIRARLAVVRHPAVAESLTGTGRLVTADRVVLVANHPVRDGAGVAQYDPLVATEALTAYFGHKPEWRPIGPVVRSQLAGYAARDEIDLSDEDWRNLIDVETWSADRTDGVVGRAVIGRHSRPHPTKWPDRAEDVAAAYPDTREVQVRILGGADPVVRTMGRLPERWIVEPFGARHPADFLADIDFFVYFHHSDWVEAFGRNIIEALASGAVVILPEHFRETYGDAAVYTEPVGVRDIVARLTAAPALYLEQSVRGRAYAAQHHGYPVHLARLEALIGPASSVRAAVPARPSRTRHRDAARARTLFISSNGTGMGHLTRLLAMANRASDRIEPFFFSMSSAVPVVARYGYSWEYCPSRDDLDITPKEWNPFFSARFTDVVRRYRPRAIVFDGTWPYKGLGEARELFPDLLYVWSRRAMWLEDHRTDPLEKADWFDLIIEPGEFAAAADHGPTVGRRDATKVAPITLLDRDDLLSRADARAALGMAADEKAMLVTLGGGNANELGPDLEAIAEAMETRPDWNVYATRAPIARVSASHADVRTISPYPLSRVMPAFDLAVVACGYNAYHEAIMAQVPTIFVPKSKVTDNQFARARYADDVGVGIGIDEVSVAAVDSAVDRLSDPVADERFRARSGELYPGNGAADAIALVERLLAERGVIR